MTDDTLPFDYPSPANQGAAPPRKCRRHSWVPGYLKNENLPAHIRWSESRQWPDDIPWIGCRRCNQPRDFATARRGRTNRSRGNAIERELCHRLGLEHTGQYGGPDDGKNAMFAAQVKSGGSFSERYWAWLRAVPVTAGQTPLLVVADAPGPGRKRRVMVVLDIEDWLALHGPVEEGA